MEKKDYIAPTIEATSCDAMLLVLSKNDEEGDGNQLSRRCSGRRREWDDEEEEEELEYQ